MRLRTATFSGLLLVAALAGTSCQVSAGSTSVKKSDVEQQVTTKLTEAVGQAPDSVTCPGDLDATVGATMRCNLESGGTSIGVNVTVTSVEDGTVNFDVKVDDAVTSTTAAE